MKVNSYLLRLKKYKDWGIKFKLLVICTLLILCSVFLVSLMSYKQYTEDFENQSAVRIQQLIAQVSLNLDTYIDDLFRLSISPYYNNKVMTALEDTTVSSDLEMLTRTRLIEDFLDQMMIIPRNDIIRVLVLTDNIYSGSRVPVNLDSSIDFKKYDWYNQALKSSAPVFVPVQLEQIVKKPKYMVFSIVSQIRSTRTPDKVIGVVKVDANYTGIESICSKVDMGGGNGFFIVDESKNIIYSDNKFLTVSNDSFLNSIYLNDNKPRTIVLDNSKYLVNSTKIARSNWTIVAINSVNELNKAAIQTRNKAFLLAIICSLSAIIIFAMFSKRFLAPLFIIVRLMKKVQKGDLSVRYRQLSNDEIGYLGSSFNTMICRINEMLDENTHLVKQIYEAQLLQKEAQFNALYSQIKPHFIYNSLNMISLLMQCGKYEKAVDNINKLSTLLRGMANVDKEVNLENELMLLDSYLSIQSSRYDDRLYYSIDIDHEFYNYRIPALLLQPIIENSVVHACENKRGKTTIKIYNEANESQLIIYISDDGIGMSSDVLEHLQQKINHLDKSKGLLETTSKRSGIGLVNVNRRIKIRYGEMYGLSIDSQPDVGTCVKIILPRNLKEDIKNA